jgi:N-acetylneuraminic acid mutarotase
VKFLYRSFVVALVFFLVGCGSQNSLVTPLPPLPPPPPPPPPVAQYTVSGTVVNLAGINGGLILQNNGTDDLPVNANGTFQFATTIASGTPFDTTVFTQPSSPAQQCTVANGIGVAIANVNNVKVECGHNEWGWMAGSQAINQIGTYGAIGTSGPNNTPGGRQNAATWTDSSGNPWLFGGYGEDSNGTLLPMNDLWKFSAGEWTWVSGPTVGGQNGNYGTLGLSSVNGIPGARFVSVSWTDAAGNFWLFGGNGFDSAGNEASLNDLWKYSAGEWTWMGGSAIANKNGVYGTLGVPDPSNMPGARDHAVVWVNSSGDVWLFGGIGYGESSTTAGSLSDLWSYSKGQWTWMGGPKVTNQKGIYGALGVAATNNVPGARFASYNWIDASGNLWLFGGVGYDSTGASVMMNDLWKYSGGQWTWVGGPNVGNQAGVYGIQGTASANNIPGARQYGVAWTDTTGSAWIFGGNGYYATNKVANFNDLWKYSGGEWTWVSGSNVGSQNSTFGSNGVLAPGNSPGSRLDLTHWTDSQGNLWLFGGYGQIPGTIGNLNDLWMYMP